MVGLTPFPPHLQFETTVPRIPVPQPRNELLACSPGMKRLPGGSPHTSLLRLPSVRRFHLVVPKQGLSGAGRTVHPVDLDDQIHG